MIRNANRWLFLLLTFILLSGMVLVVYTAQRADTLQREQLLTETRLVESAVPAANLQRLAGSESDLGSPEYRALKDVLIRQRNADPLIRFVYVLGQQQDGTLFFYADSENPGSADYSPPGETYPEASATLRGVFMSGAETTEGPASDRWGTWISGIVPVKDPGTGSITAVIGTDVDAGNWNTRILIACGPAIIGTLLLILLLLIFFYVLDRNEREMREREDAESVLRESEERFRMLFEENPNPIFIFEVPSGSVVQVNKKFVSLLGMPENAIIGTVYADLGILQDPADRDRLTSLILKNHQVNDLEFQVFHPDGTKRFFLLSARPVILKKKPCCFSIMQDISELKAVEEEMHYYSSELAKYSTLLAHTNDKLNLLNRITGHDINNQLAIVTMYLGILKERYPDAPFQEILGKLLLATGNIQRQVIFTRDYQDIGVGSSRWFNVKEVIASIVPQLPLTGISVTIAFDNLELYADPLVEKVFYTLLENTIRHGKDVTAIEFSARINGDSLVLLCQDNGEGIPGKYKEAIFDRTHFHNTGLGLYLSRAILAITGIEIRETGTQGKCARFEIMVPNGAYRFS
jgi:PAS domain S-box-containing protein